MSNDAKFETRWIIGLAFYPFALKHQAISYGKIHTCDVLLTCTSCPLLLPLDKTLRVKFFLNTGLSLSFFRGFAHGFTVNYLMRMKIVNAMLHLIPLLGYTCFGFYINGIPSCFSLFPLRLVLNKLNFLVFSQIVKIYDLHFGKTPYNNGIIFQINLTWSILRIRQDMFLLISSLQSLLIMQK